jgi:hypothetical protein
MILRDQFVWNDSFWTPSQISTALWLDAADASTITLNGSTVNQWRDKSGNVRNASQATAADQPTYTTAALNGRNVVTFDGATDFMTVPSFNTGVVSAYVVVRLTAPGVMISKRDDTNYSWEISTNSAGNVFFGPNDNANRASTVAAGISILNSVSIVGGIYNGSQSVIFINGTQGGAQNFTGSINSTPTSITLHRRLMSSPNQGFLAGYSSEVIITNTVLTTIDRQIIEGYLAWKWGLVANLPANHPYKINPPLR